MPCKKAIQVYDPLYRLANVTAAAGNEAYTHDAVGNRLTCNGSDFYEYCVNSNRLKTIHAGSISGDILSSYTYDDEGRLTAQTGPYRSSIPKTLSWDQKNRALTA